MRNVAIEGNGEVKEPKADNIEATLAMNTNASRITSFPTHDGQS